MEIQQEQWQRTGEYLWEWHSGDCKGRKADADLMSKAYYFAYTWCVDHQHFFSDAPNVHIERANIVTTEIEFDAEMFDPDRDKESLSPFYGECPNDDEFFSSQSVSYPSYKISVSLPDEEANESFEQEVVFFKLKTS
ncbi:hypothetical protein [Burkholderia sp. BC1]|uniref:hypothetical protein n=1 Tax=Burkholderia sp. BC1 TaxID=1095370 RepID=UPI004043EB35